jgi:hypothetical protein
MGYDAKKFPMERASKLGHMKVIENEHVTRLLRQFEKSDSTADEPLGGLSGNLNLKAESPIKYLITIDGGQAVIPHALRRDKRMAFIKVCAMLIKREQIAALRQQPIVDPRDLSRMFDENVIWYLPAVLPLAGIRLPGETVKDTIRKTVESVLDYTKLYYVLEYLVYRQWDSSYDFKPSTNPGAPHMRCIGCGLDIYLQKGIYKFNCNSCKHLHSLADYLGIAQDISDDWAREDAVMNLRNSLETLTLFHFIIQRWKKDPKSLNEILFVKDGPLLLRAQLSRLVEPIREFISVIKKSGANLHVVGIEKNGELVEHIEEIKHHLKNEGDFFLPSVQYMIEEVAGLSFDKSKFRNRVQYGSKVVVRIGPHHVIPLDIPTGEFLMDPKESDLMGFAESMAVLAEMTSYSHDNALIPIKLVNDYSSIAQNPSGDILKAFAGDLFN